MRSLSLCLLIVSASSGLGFLLCSAAHPGGLTFYTFVPFPNERTIWPSQSEMWLTALRQNPWVAVRLAALLVSVASAALGIAVSAAGRRKGEVQ